MKCLIAMLKNLVLLDMHMYDVGYTSNELVSYTEPP